MWHDQVSGQEKPQENMVCMHNQGRHEHMVSSQLLHAAKYAECMWVVAIATICVCGLSISCVCVAFCVCVFIIWIPHEVGSK
jgi:hypothetical protein